MATHEKIEWPTSRKEYVLGDVIGCGGSAIVCEAHCTLLNKPCAIKRINLDTYGINMNELSNEIKLMSQCNHPNIVSYYTSFVYKSELWVVMRLLSKGSLLDIIKYLEKTAMRESGEKRDPPLSEQTIATILYEILKAIDYLHKNSNIHRDIKAGNILIGDAGQVQLADFGVSAWLASGAHGRSKGQARYTFVGTPCWMAPEVMDQERGYDSKVDIWSFGITAIELATGRAPYAKFPAMKVLMMTLQNDPPRLEQCFNDFNISYSSFKKSKLDSLVAECLQKNPTKRPTAAKLLKHEFFRRVSEQVAKDPKFLDLIDKLPNFKRRAQKIKRVPGASGRLHKTEDGVWEWSDDEMEAAAFNGSQSNRQPTVPPDVFEFPNNINNIIKSDNPDSHSHSQSNRVGNEKVSPSKKHNHEVTLCLRLRNSRKELHDIKFPFNPATDNAETVTQEMISSGLLDGKNKILVACNISKLIEDVSTKSVIFKLHTDDDYKDIPNPESLHGYAKLQLV